MEIGRMGNETPKNTLPPHPAVRGFCAQPAPDKLDFRLTHPHPHIALSLGGLLRASSSPLFLSPSLLPSHVLIVVGNISHSSLLQASRLHGSVFLPFPALGRCSRLSPVAFLKPKFRLTKRVG